MNIPTPSHLEMLEIISKASEEAYMNTQNIPSTQNTEDKISALIDRTLAVIDNGLDRSVGDMTLMDAMEFVGALMDMRERQLVYAQESNPKPVRACGKACTKKPKRK